MDLVRSIMIAASGLRAQSGRMRVVAENVANADSTANAPGKDPYRRRVPTFQTSFDRELGAETVRLGRIQTDSSPFQLRYEPGHPAADANGYVKYPNVNPILETMDLKEAQRSYEANLNVISATRRMIQQTIAIIKS